MEIFVPVLVLGGAAVLCALLLTLASVFFAVKENEKIAEVRDCLPGANCGACGFSGCDGYAKALAEGACDRANLCVPGGDHTAKQIGKILGIEVADVVEQVAYVGCNGTCEADGRKYEYDGPKTCAHANMSFSGDRFCTFACLGYGDCVRVCPQGAITVTDGVADIDPKKCIGCGICTRECPNHIIHLVKDTARVVVKCSNHYKGAVVRKSCTNGCIACGKCERTCQFDAIKVVNNLAVIDYDKCTGCGACAEACPIGCIHIGSFLCGAHFDAKAR